MSLRSCEPVDGLDFGPEPSPSGLAAATGGVLLGIAAVLAAANLRPAVTSVGTVLAEVRAGVGGTSTWAGVLTTLPTLCFAGAGLAAPVLSRRFGLGRPVATALGLLAVGLVVRVLGGSYVVLGGTLVATAGIALGNVLVPVVVKTSFAARIGLMTGLCTAAMQLGAALGSGATPPLDDALGGWRQALGAWAVPALAVLALWLLVARRIGHGIREAHRTEPKRSLLRSRLAWVITAFFGLQAFVAYIMMGWLPQVLQDAGVSKTAAGLLMGLESLMAVPVSLVVVPMAARQRGQSGWIAGLGFACLAGVLGLMLAPGAQPLLWSVLVGLGMSVFSLALTVIALRARTGADVVALSGMAQGFGYLVAACGPFAFGLLHDLTDGWTVPFAVVAAVLVAQIWLGALAGRRRFV